jgi:Domain of unknown function (DUF4136)
MHSLRHSHELSVSHYAKSAVLLLAMLLVGCATQRGPEIHVNSDPAVDFSKYATFGFPEQTGTDRGGYSTLVTDYFKSAVRDQMEARGYQYVDQNPDLLVNFYANVRERSEVRSSPGASAGYGYYGYRYGLYSAWPMYANDVDTVTYKVGTANIDIVDARQKQMIWEGVAEGRIREADMEQPREAIAAVVSQLFTHYPGRPGMVDNNMPASASGTTAQ